MAADSRRVKEIFLAVSEVPAEGRVALLDRECAEDSDLRQRVEALLRAHEEPASFLRQPADTAAHRPTHGLAVGQTFAGRFKLREELGQGGMGVVFVADQTEPVQRRVALKVIRDGAESARMLARFEQERQALALMDHPNIAKVLDAGVSETGQPYFVMELIKGVPLTDYCDQAKLTPRERLELFIPVCQAVQHAHQKGIIHRDLKPSNILVALYDGKPVPKVIDFGVAKAIGRQLSEHSIYTEVGSVIGTLEYMSPEQAELNNLDVDTRSDVYALGAILYELLTGTVPLSRKELQAGGFAEMLRCIKEKEPPRPSTRLSSSSELPSVAGLRRTEPVELSRLVRGELDWIVMKALEKDRNRRYESANGLARDVGRYLSDEPVEACPPSWGYRLRKQARKHKAAFALVTAVAAALLVGLAATTWQAVRAMRAEGVAVANAKLALKNEEDAKQQRDEAEKRRDEVIALNEKVQVAQAQRHRALYAARMNLAQNAWEAGGVERVRDLLRQQLPEEGESDLRGFEWHYLNGLCHWDLLTLEHEGPVLSVAYSPDGKRLASASKDKTVKVWDAQTGKALLTLTGADFVSAVFDSEGKRLATASGGRTRDERTRQGQIIPGGVKVWDAQTGKELLTVEDSGGEGPAAFSPDGKYLARCVRKILGGDGVAKRVHVGAVKVWDSRTGQVALSLECRSDADYSVAFSPDSKRLACGPRQWQGFALLKDKLGVKVWDLETGKELTSLEGYATVLAFSPDGKRLAVSDSTNKRLAVWDARTGEKRLALEGDARTVAFSPDGKRLAGASRDGKAVAVWHAETGQELFTLQGHAAELSQVVFSPDGKCLASASGDKTVKVWDSQTGQVPFRIRGVLAYSPDGTCVATTSGGLPRDKSVVVRDAQTRQEVLAIKGDNSHVSSVAFSPDGKRLAIGRQGGVIVWDAKTGAALVTLEETARIRGLAFSPDGAWLVGERKEKLGSGQLKVWDARTGKAHLTIDSSLGSGAAFSPDGKRLVSGSGNEVKMWDAQTGKAILTLAGHTDTVLSVAYSPDGKRLASSGGLSVKVWDARTGEGLLCLEGHTDTVLSVAFSPDGKRLASASADKMVKVWDAQSGQEFLTLKHADPVISVVFSLDGRRLATGSSNNDTAQIWDATPRAQRR